MRNQGTTIQRKSLKVASTSEQWVKRTQQKQEAVLKLHYFKYFNVCTHLQYQEY